MSMLMYNAFFGFTGLVGELDILDENTSTQGVAYDYRSLMHPVTYAFGNGRTITIVPVKFSGRVSKRVYPSDSDTLHIKILYCEGNTYN